MTTKKAETQLPLPFNTPYDGNRNRVEAKIGDDGLTEQNHKDACNVNKIVSRFQKTGLLDHLNSAQPMEIDSAPPISYHEALNIVAQGKTAFETLPATLRQHFEHDAAKYVEFCMNPENREELVKMGLAVAPIPPLEPETAPNPTPPSAPAEKGSTEA